jgi:ferrous iron transport protein A
MTLSQCNKNDLLRITKINAQGTLKQRLLSFGVVKGEEIRFIAFSPAKSTIEIKVGKAHIALRKEEASIIEVEKL